MLIRQGEASWVVVFPLTVRMDTSLLALLTLSLTVSLSCQAEEVTKFQDCYSCLVFGPQDYIWCLEANETGSLAKGCISRSEHCEYPYTDKSEQTDSGDNPTASILPQKVTLKLRPKKEETVKFQAKKKENDIDMYFLLDLTSSMGKIKTKLGDITDDLMTKLGNKTSKCRFGYGFFREKPKVPMSKENENESSFEHRADLTKEPAVVKK